MRIRIVISFGTFWLMLTAVVSAQTSTMTDSVAIERRFSNFQKILLARDTVSLIDYYTEDAVSLRQNQPTTRGREAIMLRWKKSLVNPIAVRWTSSELDVSMSRQDAYQFGTFEIHIADTTNALLASGKVMFVWKKQEDRWRIALEMDNFNPPPSRGTPPERKQ